MEPKTYKINEIFYSLQGEGLRAGEPSVFVRFSNCNLACSVSNYAGFNCDTEFTSGRDMCAQEIYEYIQMLTTKCSWIVFTGGEPGLQLDSNLIEFFKERKYLLAIETNGTIALPDGLDHICVSPKSAEHTLKQVTATEVKYVRKHGQGIPETRVAADAYLISPAFDAEGLPQENLAWCIDLCLKNPSWQLSSQQHKLWKVR